MIDNWGREISDFGFGIYIYIYETQSSINNSNNSCLVYPVSIYIYIGRLIIWLIIIGFRIDLAATFALQSSNLNFISLTV